MMLASALGALLGIAIVVSPSGETLEEAVARARKAPAGALREIILADGTHFVERQLEFTAADSNFVFRAEHPGKAVVTGAKPVVFRPDPKDARLWEADFPFAAAGETLYALTVNGRLAEFAAYPQYGGDRRLRYAGTEADAAQKNFTKLVYDPLDLPDGFTFEDFDTTSAFLFIPQEWASSRCYVATNDWRNHTFYLKNRPCFPLGRFNQGYQVLNTRLGLRHPGTWMFEAKAGKIRYWPTDEDRLRPVRAGAVAKTSGLFYFDGASDVRFEDLVLEGCASPFTVDCHLKPIPGLVTAHSPTNIAIVGCELRNAAGAGIHFVKPRNCVTRGCHMHGLGSYGLHHFWGGSGSVVENCHAHDNGRYALAAPAIELQGLDHCNVVSNHVHHTPGCGFVMWCEYSVFASNHLHHTMRSVRDGGGLYGGQNFSKLFDNYVHDCGDWSGLYNDEGGRSSVYYGNRFENCWWPFHMHDTYGIVITNNHFRSDDYMRFSLQGSTHSVFKDNFIDSPAPIPSYPQLEACDEWSNDVRVKRPDGTYGPARRVTFTRRPEPPKSALEVPRLPAAKGLRPEFRGARVILDRDRAGLAVPGVPGGWVSFGFDETNLCVHGRYEYNKFVGYPGSVNTGHEWGRHDGMRLCLGDLDVEVFFDGTVRATDGSVAFGPENAFAKRGRSVGDGFATFAFQIPLSRFGFASGSVLGRTLAFNAIFYNHDHREYKYAYAPRAGVELRAAGTMRFAEPTFDRTASVRHADCLGGPSWPGGRIRAVPETATRRARLTGCAVALDDQTCGLRLLPFTGADPMAGKLPEQRLEAASESARPYVYSGCVENWSLALKMTADADCAYISFTHDHVPVLRLLVDCPTRACAVTDGILTAEAGLFAKMAFSPKPIAVRELEAPTAEGRRYVLDFAVTPVISNVTVRASVGRTADEAARRFAVRERDFDFKARVEACRKAWNERLESREPYVPYVWHRGEVGRMVAEIREIARKTGLRRFQIAGPGFTAVMFGPFDPDLYAQMGREIADVKKAVATDGLEIGWWCSPSIRYCADFAPIEDAAGNRSADNKKCPLDPAFQSDWTVKVKSVVAAVRPQMINIEDDFTLAWGRGLKGGACFCRRHLDAFARRYGKALTGPEIEAAFANRTEANAGIRRAFAETVRDSLCAIARKVRAAIDEVDPTVRVCVCEPGASADKDGDALCAVARAFAGPNTRPAIRPSGAIYGAQTTPADIPGALGHTLYTLERTPREFEMFYEADPYPHNRFFTSASQMASLMAGATFMGSQNVLFYCLQYLDDPLEDPGYADAYRALRPRLDAVRDFIETRRSRLAGVRAVWNSDDLALTRGFGGGHGGQLADEAFLLAKFGLPYTTRADADGPSVLAGNVVETIPESELRRILAGGVLLDAPAADLVAKRGFGELLGTEVRLADGRLPIVREQILPAAGCRRKGRDVNAFYVFCAGTEGTVSQFATLNPKAGTQVWSEFSGADGKSITPSLTYATNALGGRVAVLATSLLGNRASGLLNLRKQELYRNLFANMKPNGIPVQVLEAPGIWVLAQVSEDGREMLVMVNNLSGDRREGVALAVSPAWCGAQVSRLDASGHAVVCGTAESRHVVPCVLEQMAPEFFVFRR